MLCLVQCPSHASNGHEKHQGVDRGEHKLVGGYLYCLVAPLTCVRYKIVQYSTVQYITLHYITVQYSTVQHNAIEGIGDHDRISHCVTWNKMTGRNKAAK